MRRRAGLGQRGGGRGAGCGGHAAGGLACVDRLHAQHGRGAGHRRACVRPARRRQHRAHGHGARGEPVAVGALAGARRGDPPGQQPRRATADRGLPRAHRRPYPPGVHRLRHLRQRLAGGHRRPRGAVSQPRHPPRARRCPGRRTAGPAHRFARGRLRRDRSPQEPAGHHRNRGALVSRGPDRRGAHAVRARGVDPSRRLHRPVRLRGRAAPLRGWQPEFPGVVDPARVGRVPAVDRPAGHRRPGARTHLGADRPTRSRRRGGPPRCRS